MRFQWPLRPGPDLTIYLGHFVRLFALRFLIYSQLLSARLEAAIVPFKCAKEIVWYRFSSNKERPCDLCNDVFSAN